LDYKCKRDALDFNKIYDILQYDIVTPFVGASGGKRDDYVYGIIKLLEIEFHTRLKFHEKLNESQTFYTFSSAKRADAWKAYLLDNNIVKSNQVTAPPFAGQAME